MIARLVRNSLGFCYFSATKLAGKAVAEMPQIQFPTKPKTGQDQQFPMHAVYETLNYLRKDRLPNCKYFALEYKNRIYHFYNAYYFPMGRMIDRVATQIRGKASPHYRNSIANVNNGDICVIVNIEDPLITGKKILNKKLRYHTGFVGHLREHSYKQVLNNKPELLYHYLLRRVMPKNKVSEKYMQNLVLCRGPTHNYKQFPQFAPDRKTYSLLPKIDLLEMIKQDEDIQVIEESEPGASREILQREAKKYLSEREKIQIEREKDEAIEDLTQVHEDMEIYKSVPNITQKEFEVMKRKEKKIEARYKPVRAPNRKKVDPAANLLKGYRDERKARKDPQYELLSNEDLEQVDDENTAPNPHVIGGVVSQKFKDK